MAEKLTVSDIRKGAMAIIGPALSTDPPEEEKKEKKFVMPGVKDLVRGP